MCISAHGDVELGRMRRDQDPAWRAALRARRTQSGSCARPAVAAQLKHPGIVALHETGQTSDGTFYLVEEFVEGRTLANVLWTATGRSAFHRQAAELIADVADALDYAHRHGVIHRDVKPSNIQLDLEGRPHVMDFGLASREAEETSMTQDGSGAGHAGSLHVARTASARRVARSRRAQRPLQPGGRPLRIAVWASGPFRGARRMLILQVLEDEGRARRGS